MVAMIGQTTERMLPTDTQSLSSFPITSLSTFPITRDLWDPPSFPPPPIKVSQDIVLLLTVNTSLGPLNGTICATVRDLTGAV